LCRGGPVSRKAGKKRKTSTSNKEKGKSTGLRRVEPREKIGEGKKDVGVEISLEVGKGERGKSRNPIRRVSDTDHGEGKKNSAQEGFS